jgi:hypothetical protein
MTFLICDVNYLLLAALITVKLGLKCDDMYKRAPDLCEMSPRHICSLVRCYIITSQVPTMTYNAPGCCQKTRELSSSTFTIFKLSVVSNLSFF